MTKAGARVPGTGLLADGLAEYSAAFGNLARGVRTSDEGAGNTAFDQMDSCSRAPSRRSRARSTGWGSERIIEHWFDRLAAAPHPRRIASKAAGAGLAALSLPPLWPERSVARPTEEGYRFCLNAAYAHPAELALTDCAELRNQAKSNGPKSKAAHRAAACTAKAVAEYERGKLKCGQPECGDPQT